MLINLSNRLIFKDIGRICHKSKCNVYLVGGVVRDLILHKTSKDLDITIEIPGKISGIRIIKKISAHLRRKYRPLKVKYYEDFGTATILFPERCFDAVKRIDFVAARKEKYINPGSLPQVYPGRLTDDLFRRDFTINAVAVSLNKKDFGAVIDPFGGLKDIENKTIRILHSDSFKDDPTRLLRALRFSSRLDFKLAGETKKLFIRAIKQNYIDKVSKERIRNEFILALKEQNTGKCLRSFLDYGINLVPQKPAGGRIFPEFRRRGFINGKNFSMLNSRYLDKYPVETKLSVLLNGLKIEEIRDWLKEMKMSSALSNEILSVFRFLYTGNKHKLPVWAAVFFKAINFTPKTIQITGYDLKKMGLKPGPLFGKILKDVNSNPKLDTIGSIKKYIVKKYKTP